jgi:hypothetical protein|tara:strand:+ start:1227 stop:1403 length:177 start_codon:yes stop_codon:yes gene_type:complete
MKATKPLCAKAVTPINAIKNIIIGNMKNFLRLAYNSKISLIVENFILEKKLEHIKKLR